MVHRFLFDTDILDAAPTTMAKEHNSDSEGSASSSDEGSSVQEEIQTSADHEGTNINNNPEEKRDDASDSSKSNDGDGNQRSIPKKPRKIHKLSMTQTENFNAKLKKRGVVYLARIPPKMSPSKVKKILQEMDKRIEVTRIYLVEEDPTVRKRRRKEYGGNGSKRYVEGWIEFSNKKIAKHVALSLNNTPISNEKRNAHYGDLWNLKYLHKFEWSHLTEKVAYERRVKEQKLRLETMQARKETAAYKQLVEKGHKLDKIEERLQRKREKAGGKKGNDSVKDDSKKRKKSRQITPMDDGAAKSTHKSLLGSLV